MGSITSRMTLVHIKAAGYARGALDRMRNDDRGQGTLEYVGIVLAAVALCGVVAMFIRTELGAKVVDALEGALERIGVGDGGTPAPEQS